MKTITTIEVTNACNLKCPYCVNRLMQTEARRPAVVMADKTFDRTCELLKELCLRGTQAEVNLNGNGESTIDPKLPERIRKVKDIMGVRRVLCSSNGINITRDYIKRLVDAGLDRLDLSPHSIIHARKAMFIIAELGGLECCLNMGSFSAPHNWAGQLEPENSVAERWLPKIDCHPIKEQRAYIQAEGDVVPCCYDYRNLGKIGHVDDLDILEREGKPFELCKTCHQKLEA